MKPKSQKTPTSAIEPPCWHAIDATVSRLFASSPWFRYCSRGVRFSQSGILHRRPSRRAFSRTGAMLYVKAAQARADAEFSLAEARRSARAGSTVARDAVARAARAEEASVTLCDEARGDDREPGDAAFCASLTATEGSCLTAPTEGSRSIANVGADRPRPNRSHSFAARARGCGATRPSRYCGCSRAKSVRRPPRARRVPLRARPGRADTQRWRDDGGVFVNSGGAFSSASYEPKELQAEQENLPGSRRGGGRATTARRRRHCLGCSREQAIVPVR